MKLRIFTEPQQGADYDDLLRIARATEDLGFDGFFRSDHYLHMGDVSGLPDPSDAWVTLAGLARETSRIRLGTLVTSATFRRPGPLAISVANVDRMSGGRVEFGIGAGWFEAEHAAYGMPFPDVAERFDRLEEQVAIVHGLWTTPEAEPFDFDGVHYQLAGSPGRPKPLQSPPPIILGGAGKKRAAALAARYAAEYNCPFASLEDSRAAFDRVRAAVAVAGRPAESMTYSIAQVAVVGRDEAEFARRAAAIGRDPGELRRTSFAGTVDEVVDAIARFAGIGARTCYLQILDLADVEHLELIASQVAPRL